MDIIVKFVCHRSTTDKVITPLTLHHIPKIGEDVSIKTKTHLIKGRVDSIEHCIADYHVVYANLYPYTVVEI